MPLHDSQVKFILQGPQTLTVGIDNSDIVVLANQVSASVPPTWPAPRMIIFISRDPLSHHFLISLA
ncbi:Uncharacterised protein [Escherichia coli]|uniref:Uncharacterized protein n=1 Tax=Escherichia coli TaxID=562 RepID=A0A376TWP7_ECOLX|nr:Uncharacterised protein [Escherichia coli]